MGYLAWTFDIIGYVVFFATSSVQMYALAAVLCGVGAVIGHIGKERTEADLVDRVRCLNARNSSFASLLIIGVFAALTAAGVLGH